MEEGKDNSKAEDADDPRSRDPVHPRVPRFTVFRFLCDIKPEGNVITVVVMITEPISQAVLEMRRRMYVM